MFIYKDPKDVPETIRKLIFVQSSIKLNVNRVETMLNNGTYKI